MLVTYEARAATLNGEAIDFTFTLGVEDRRVPYLAPGSRVMLLESAIGIWRTVTVPGMDGKIPVDEVSTVKVGETYGQAMHLTPGAPSLALVDGARRRASSLGVEVKFQVESVWIAERDGTRATLRDVWVIKITVPGRGKIRRLKADDERWEEVLADAGLGDTI